MPCIAFMRTDKYNWYKRTDVMKNPVYHVSRPGLVWHHSNASASECSPTQIHVKADNAKHYLSGNCRFLANF